MELVVGIRINNSGSESNPVAARHHRTDCKITDTSDVIDNKKTPDVTGKYSRDSIVEK